MVGRLDDHPDALGLQHVLDRVGDLSGQTLLDLKPLGLGLDYARQLGDADDTRIWHIGDPSTADDWRDVVLAMTLERDTLEHSHLVITVGFLERLLQDLLGVLPIAAKVLLESASHTRGCFAQTISIRILANPVKNSSKRSFYVFLRRVFALPARIRTAGMA